MEIKNPKSEWQLKNNISQLEDITLRTFQFQLQLKSTYWNWRLNDNHGERLFAVIDLIIVVTFKCVSQLQILECN